MVDVNYVNYNMFGQSPSRNFRWNLLEQDKDMPTTPYFANGTYYAYYCLLSNNVIYKGTPKLIQEG